MQLEQYEAALQIWDAHDALVKGLKASTVDLEKIANAMAARATARRA